jgi:hypothetical protein
MLGNEAQAAQAAILLSPVSAANTAAATSGWVDVRGYEGDLLLCPQIGALTGTLAWTVEDAEDGTGTNNAAMTPNEGAFAAGAANQVQKRTVNAGATRGWVKLIGTIVGGPALVAATLKARPKNL